MGLLDAGFIRVPRLISSTPSKYFGQRAFFFDVNVGLRHTEDNFQSIDAVPQPTISTPSVDRTPVHTADPS